MSIWKKMNHFMSIVTHSEGTSCIITNVKGPNAKQNVWTVSLLSQYRVKHAHPLTQKLSYLLWNVVSNPLTLDLEFLMWSSSVITSFSPFPKLLFSLRNSFMYVIFDVNMFLYFFVSFQFWQAFFLCFFFCWLLIQFDDLLFIFVLLQFVSVISIS